MICFIGQIIGMSSYAQENSQPLVPEYKKWLKEQFSDQHEKLIPVVAVADMYFACNRTRNVDEEQFEVQALVTQLDRNVLAEKLISCLKGELPNSDTALNFGLEGCFFEQIKSLPESERKIKQKLVAQAIASLSREERQKSFTQCVTDQAIGYLR